MADTDRFSYAAFIPFKSKIRSGKAGIIREMVSRKVSASQFVRDSVTFPMCPAILKALSEEPRTYAVLFEIHILFEIERALELLVMVKVSWWQEVMGTETL